MILPLYNSLAPLTLNRVFAAAPAYDPDAQAYIDAVELEDGQALEVGVKDAINDFVVGCKSDGIWSAIKASCILAGARTLDGALVPLVGSAPTNNNFVSGDYDRETGLVGNASTKYLATARNNNSDPQNDNHNAVYIHTVDATVFGAFYLGAGGGTTGANSLTRGSSVLPHAARNRSSTRTEIGGNTPPAGFFGMARSASGSYTVRNNSTNTSISVTSQTPSSDEIFVFVRNNGSGTPQFYSNSRLQFYSIGESLDLADLDSRVSTLMTDLAAAI